MQGRSASGENQVVCDSVNQLTQLVDRHTQQLDCTLTVAYMAILEHELCELMPPSSSAQMLTSMSLTRHDEDSPRWVNQTHPTPMLIALHLTTQPHSNARCSGEVERKLGWHIIRIRLHAE